MVDILALVVAGLFFLIGAAGLLLLLSTYFTPERTDEEDD